MMNREKLQKYILEQREYFYKHTVPPSEPQIVFISRNLFIELINNINLIKPKIADLNNLRLYGARLIIIHEDDMVVFSREIEKFKEE